MSLFALYDFDNLFRTTKVTDAESFAKNNWLYNIVDEPTNNANTNDSQ